MLPDNCYKYKPKFTTMKTINTFIALAATLTISFTAITATHSNPLMGQNSVGPGLIAHDTPLIADGTLTKRSPEQAVFSKPEITGLTEATNIREEYNYLRFDVNGYYNENETEITELPDPEFNYLKFDVNFFQDMNPVNPKVMPVSEFEYLRFDVNQFINADNPGTDEAEELLSAE